MLQFNRKAQLIVTSKTLSEKLTFDGLRITFSITKGREGAKNKAKISVYNLSEATIGKLKSAEVSVTLMVGYGDSLATIFSGDAPIVTDTKIDTDRVLVFSAIDGLNSAKKKVSVSYPPKTTAKTIIDDISKIVKIDQKAGNQLGIKDRIYKNGITLVNTFDNIMNSVTKYANTEWSIQNGDLKLVEKGKSDSTEIILISGDTGMIGTPGAIESANSSEVDATNSNKVTGYSVKLLLNAGIEPASKVAIDSIVFTDRKVFTVDTVEHTGDTHGDEWNTALQVIEEKNYVLPKQVGVNFK